MVEIVISVAAKVAEYLVGPIVHPIGYVWNYKSNFDKLKIELQKLEVRRNELQQSVVEAQRQGEDIFEHVQNWLNRVQNMVDEASQVVQEMGQANIRCPNPKKRYQHSKRAAKKAEAVAGLRLEENFTRVSKTSIPKEIWIPSHIGYEAFRSRETTLEGIQNALIDPDINMIGVHGLGGIGKTTLARKVAEFAEKNNLFNVVAFSEVKEKPDIEKIQQEIAARLGLTLDKESPPSERAKKLQDRLRNEEKVLLVLDNIWERLNLVDVGIPLGDDHKGCKLLLTARDLNALTSTGSEHNIPLNFLNDEEAWNLFCTAAGECVEQSELQDLAKKVANACGGLPIAIVTIAKALRTKKVPEWRKALKDLKSPSPSTLQGVAKETCFCIEFTYNQLEGEELKSIFLLCSAMQSSYGASVEDLVKYVLGLDEFRSADRIQDVRDHVDCLVQRLKDASLLLYTPNNKSILMHDVVRDVGRIIASKKQHMVKVLDDNVPWNWYEENVVNSITRIFLHNVSQLPEELGCPDLQILYMETTNEELKIPDNFFAGMSKLTVLHLVGFDLMSLPTSLTLLIDLRMLYIKRDRVQDIALIGELIKLEILCIDGYGIERLSEEICKLNKLRLLDLSKHPRLEVTPKSIASLTQLEELYLGYNVCQWEVQEGGEASVAELKYLPQQLSVLEITIPNTNALSKGLFSKKLERYNIGIGRESYGFFSQQNMTYRTLVLNIGNGCRCLEDVLQEMPSVKNVLIALDGGEGFPTLKQLEVRDSSCFRTVYDSENSFPSLETLSLVQLVNLTKIYNGQFEAKFLSHLRYLQVKLCKSLKNIFSVSTVEVLPLEEIEVEDCINMREIFVIGTEEDKFELKKLRSIHLINVPQLKSFYSRINSQTILEDECDTPIPLFNEKIGFPNLETLELSMMNCELIWHNQSPAIPTCFQRLRDLTVVDNDKLKCLFSSSKIAFPNLETILIRGMTNLEMIWDNQLVKDAFGRLKSIDVTYCNKLEYIFSSSMVVFSSLENISITCLENLEKIWDNQLAQDSFGKLKFVKVEECHKLKYLFSTSIAFPNLKFILIRGMTNLEMIWDNQPAQDSFGKLNFVQVEECHKLKYLFSTSTVSFPKLKYLVLVRMDANKMISQCQFLQLQSLDVYDDKSVVYPLCAFQRFHHLNKLLLSDCWYEGMLPYGEVEKKHISNQDSKRDLVLHFEVLDVRRCHRLIALAPPSTNFHHLTTLTVHRCGGLRSLVTLSTAKSLVQLTTLTINDCPLMTEVVTKEGDVEEGEIVFSNLKSLKLSDLSNLTSFCSWNYVLNFPSLEELLVENCPCMKIFSPQVLPPPLLQSVGYQKYWEGDHTTYM